MVEIHKDKQRLFRCAFCASLQGESLQRTISWQKTAGNCWRGELMWLMVQEAAEEFG